MGRTYGCSERNISTAKKSQFEARPSKCYMGYSEVEFLGHVVGQGVVKLKPHKKEAIQNAERPKTKTQLRSFLGLAGYYRKFIPDLQRSSAL